MYNQGTESPDFVEVQNNLAELNLDHNNLKESYETSRETTLSNIVSFHSEGAKCFTIIAKVFLAKGELKGAFENIDLAYRVLKSCLVKLENDSYNEIFMQHPYYLDIHLHRIKIYNRQLKHDMALKELDLLKRIVKIKCEHTHSETDLASVYEEEAQSLLCGGSIDEF